MNKKITDFSINLDDNTKKQFDECCNNEFVISASLMPDAHSGYVAPIGSVLLTKNVLVPAWVGYDIGCGMIAYKVKGKDIFNKLQNKKQEIFDEVQKEVPMGVGRIGVHGDVSCEMKQLYREMLESFKKQIYNNDILKFLKTQAQAHLGSLGSGNHFIELGYIDENNKDELWLVIHSGSRGVGKYIAKHYMQQASGKEENFEKTYTLDDKEEKGKEYLGVLNFCLDFALLNRQEIAKRVENVLKNKLEINIDFDLWVNKNHNHAIEIENPKKYFSSIMDNVDENDRIYIHRKGATPAMRDEKGVIPANMRDGSFLVKGLGNINFLYSSSHGAGRKLSRKKAKEEISMTHFRDDMSNIVGKIDEDTLDESPNAYKNIYDVMESQKTSVEIVSHIKPLINWKGN